MADLSVLGGAELVAAGNGIPPEGLEASNTGAPSDASARRAWGWRSPVFWLRRPGLTVSIVVVVLVALWAMVPSLFATDDPYRIDPNAFMQPPSASHWFGTDETGRDLYSRVVYGAQGSLTAATLAVVVALTGGVIFGLISGFRGGRLDDLIMRSVDVVQAIPALLLALAVVTALGFGNVNIGLAVGLVGIGAFTRLMRSEVLRVRTMPYVEAAHSMGVRVPAILARHVMPNSSGPVLVLATLEFGTALLAISAMSFLGFGSPPPTPEWGSMVAEGRQFLHTAWWLTTFPGLVIAASVLAVNRISRALEGEHHD